MGETMTVDQQDIMGEHYARKLSEEEDARLAQQLQADLDLESANPQPISSSQTYEKHNHSNDEKSHRPSLDEKKHAKSDLAPPAYGEPSGKPALRASVSMNHKPHANTLSKAASLRAQDEVTMQNMLLNLQYRYGIYNSELEPEHETDYPCSCDVHQYMYTKWNRAGIQEVWNKAVAYPGEKIYGISRYNNGLLSGNPYLSRIRSPYPYLANSGWSGIKRASPKSHEKWIESTISLNNSLNTKAQAEINDKEPKANIWEDGVQLSEKKGGWKSLMKAKVPGGIELRDAILQEEEGRWPDEQWRQLVHEYQVKTGMVGKIAHLRYTQPIQYLHLLRAGYFEPIPVAWATQNSNPLKFTIEASDGWRGITPSWRGYEDTAEERLYWVLNHREGSVGMRMKPDFISEMNMARERMAKAVAPPPAYFDSNDTCHTQHITDGYSKQVLPAPFQAYDQPETAQDDTMILLDVSGSMGFEPQRPLYDRYLITRFENTNQPKNKDVAKAIIRRFTDAMANRDQNSRGYDLTVFSSSASYIGAVNHRNLDTLWRNIQIGGGTRVMTGWQKVKDLHFRKHSESAVHHPVYGWQAGPQTPILRLLLLLDGEATDMDEFELDLLGLSWAHVTIFLIGAEGCPHHHRHANELQRISDVNHHVSFVDAQGNTPERFVTHELLKRHLGYDLSMREFQELEVPPVYSE